MNDIDNGDNVVLRTDASTKHLLPSGTDYYRRIALGSVVVTCIALSWVGAVQTTKLSYSNGFSAPMFLVWFGTCWMMTTFPVASVLHFISSSYRCQNLESATTYWSHCTQIFSPRGITPCSLLTSTVLFTSLWIGTNYFYSRALMYTAATDVATLTSSSSAFIVVLSICILREPVLFLRVRRSQRVFSVGFSCGGIVLFSYSDGFQPVSAVGVILSVASAVGIALYKVLLKWRFGEVSMHQMALFLSTIGALNAIVLFPVVLSLHFAGFETLFRVPWTYAIVSSIFGMLFNFLINFGITYTYPLFISLGTLLGIPINAIIDATVHNVDFLNWKITGAVLIIIGFLMLLAPPSDSFAIHRLTLKLFNCTPNVKTKAAPV